MMLRKIFLLFCIMQLVMAAEDDDKQVVDHDTAGNTGDDKTAADEKAAQEAAEA